MLSWVLEVSELISKMKTAAFEALSLAENGDTEAVKLAKKYLGHDARALSELLEKGGMKPPPTNLGRHIAFGEAQDFKDIVGSDLPALERQFSVFVKGAAADPAKHGFEDLLHPIITAASLGLYQAGNYREAVLNSVTALFDQIRDRTGVQLDGTQLVGQVFSLANPRLIFSELNTESGRNDQKGFMQIIEGAYTGIRNPKAHTLAHDVTAKTAAEYLVFTSLLARRVAEATLVPPVVAAPAAAPQRKTR